MFIVNFTQKLPRLQKVRTHGSKAFEYINSSIKSNFKNVFQKFKIMFILIYYIKNLELQDRREEVLNHLRRIDEETEPLLNILNSEENNAVIEKTRFEIYVIISIYL